MTTLKVFYTFAILFFSSLLFSQDGQILFSLQQLSDQSWGVFIKPDEATFPSNQTLTGTGQITIVAPVDFEYDNLTAFNGSWVENARVNAPEEALYNAYISFGFEANNPKIEMVHQKEILLFTFTTDPLFNGAFHLFENGNDPFDAPNSKSTNPGNEIGMLDVGYGTDILTYRYGGNYEAKNKGAMAIMMSDDEGGSDGN